MTLSWEAKDPSDPRVCLKTQTRGLQYKVATAIHIKKICAYKDNINSCYVEKNLLLEGMSEIVLQADS